MLKIDAAEAEKLPEPSANPGALEVDADDDGSRRPRRGSLAPRLGPASPARAERPGVFAAPGRMAAVSRGPISIVRCACAGAGDCRLRRQRRFLVLDAGSSGEATSAAKSEGSDLAPRPSQRSRCPSGPAPKKLTEKELVEGTGAEAKRATKSPSSTSASTTRPARNSTPPGSRSEPFSFTLGAGEVIPGWDQGVEGMKVGGRRELIIPPELAYGAAGSPPAIGPNETLIFVIDLLAVK